MKSSIDNCINTIDLSFPFPFFLLLCSVLCLHCRFFFLLTSYFFTHSPSLSSIALLTHSFIHSFTLTFIITTALLSLSLSFPLIHSHSCISCPDPILFLVTTLKTGKKTNTNKQTTILAEQKAPIRFKRQAHAYKE